MTDHDLTPEKALAEALMVQHMAFLDQPESFETREAVADFLLAALAERGYRVSKSGEPYRLHVAGERSGKTGALVTQVVEAIKAAMPSDVTVTGDLDAAWAAAEAALPKGWWVEKVYLRERGTRLETMSAWARRPNSDGGLRGDGPTPAEALNALAAQLKAGEKP